MKSSADRIERFTSKETQTYINHKTYHNLENYSERPEMIEWRILELKKEWDIERTLEANASAISLVGISLGYFVHSYWFILSGIVMIFLLQHAIQGWCPPLPLFRKLGKRTFHEIEEERHALKALRGDYKQVESPAEALENSMRD
jgi:hypothetical protein